MRNLDYGTPYIPLSWLREERKWAKAWFQAGNTFDSYDLWLYTVQQEQDRLTIQELIVELHQATKQIERLEKENLELIGKEFAINEKYVTKDSDYTEYNYGYND